MHATTVTEFVAQTQCKCLLITLLGTQKLTTTLNQYKVIKPNEMSSTVYAFKKLSMLLLYGPDLLNVSMCKHNTLITPEKKNETLKLGLQRIMSFI